MLHSRYCYGILTLNYYIRNQQNITEKAIRESDDISNKRHVTIINSGQILIMWSKLCLGHTIF